MRRANSLNRFTLELRTSFFLLLAYAFMLATTIAAAAAQHEDLTNARIADGLQSLQQFYRSQSTSDLQSAVEKLSSALQIREIDPRNYAIRRRTLVAAWAQTLLAIQKAYPVSFDPNNDSDLAAVCVNPPSGRYSCGVSPEDIQDPNERAQYTAALLENQLKYQRGNLYSRVYRLEGAARASLRVQLALFRRLGAPPDSAALSEIVKQAGLSVDRQKAVDAMF